MSALRTCPMTSWECARTPACADRCAASDEAEVRRRHWPRNDVAQHVFAALSSLPWQDPRYSCLCAPGVCADIDRGGLTVRCDMCGGLMFASTLAHAMEAIDRTEPTWRPDADDVW